MKRTHLICMQEMLMSTDSIRDAAFCDVLNRELVCALGCTEPIAVAYAAALASQTLGCEP